MKIYNKNGFTLTETLVGTILVLIVFMSLFGLYQLGIKVNIKSRARIMATAIANERIEKIKNFSYSEVKYAPEGKIVQLESVFDGKYNVATTIIPVSDCFDGPMDPSDPQCLEAPLSDDCEIDYKRVKVEVFWTVAGGGSVELIDDVIPSSLTQECEEEKGILFVSVIDASSESVNSPLIQIIDPQTLVVVASQQPLEGSYNFVLFPGSYKVRAEAFGYQEETYGRGETYFFNGQQVVIDQPEKENPIVAEDGVTSVAFQMDELGSINVQTRNEEDEAIGNISFNVQGTKLIGQDAMGDPIYKYFYSNTTDFETGERLISGLDFDSYYFSVESYLYELLFIDPSQPVDLYPGQNITTKLVLVEEGSLLAIVVDTITSSPIFGANVNLWKEGYSESRPTNGSGEAFFSPLESDNYNLNIEASGYSNYQGSVYVSGETIIEARMQPL